MGSIKLIVNLDPVTIQESPFRITEPSEKALLTLKRSIERHGVLQPIHVRIIDEFPYEYQIIDGNCRWEEAAKLGIQVPAFVHGIDLEAAKLMAQELNLLGSELNHTKVAILFRDNSLVVGKGSVPEFTTWSSTVVESYIEMASFNWHDYTSETAAGQGSLFAPEEGGDNDTGEKA